MVCSAAVADYKPAQPSLSKIKKKEAQLNLELVKTKDILAELGKLKQQQFTQLFLNRNHQLMVTQVCIKFLRELIQVEEL